jgi:hypothetical protein
MTILLGRNVREIRGIPSYMMTIPGALNIYYVPSGTCKFFHKSEAQMNLLSLNTPALLNGTTYSSGSG